MDLWYLGTLTEEQCRRSEPYRRGYEDALNNRLGTNPYSIRGKKWEGWTDEDSCLYAYGAWSVRGGLYHFGPALYDEPAPISPVQLDLFGE